MLHFDLMCCVVPNEQGPKVFKIAKQNGVKGATIFMGHGTIKNKLLELLELHDSQKEILFMIARRESSRAIMETLYQEMAFHKRGNGIIFSIALDNFIGTRHKEYQQPNADEVNDTMYSAVFTVVEKGLGEDAVEAAVAAGARGGTIINARGSGINETSTVFAMPIEPEKEVVMILTQNDVTEKIVTAIRAKMKTDESGKGIVFVVPITEAYGLY